MKKDDVSHLLQRFLSARDEGKEIYFDADQIEDLLDSFEESDDYTYYDEVLALGLRLHPGNNNLQIKRCRLYVYNEDYDSALALMDTIAETDNQDLDMLRIECYCMQNKYDKVIEYTETLIAIDCEYLEDIFEYITPILSDMEMHKEAMNYIDRGLSLFPDNPTLKDELCYNLETEGDIPRAIQVCNELIDNNPYSYEYWFTLGRLHSMIADYDKAIEAFDFALTCDDSDFELKILKAYCLYMNESYEKAIDVYTEIGSGDEDTTTRIKPLMAECYIKLEKYEEAYQLLKTLIESEALKEDPSAYINYLRCCVETEREFEASEMLYKAIELFPDNIRILSLLAITYTENNEEELAASTTNKLFKLLEHTENSTNEDCATLLQTGQYLYLKGDTASALKYYKKVLALSPDTPYIHMHIAMTYLALGDMKHFNEHFQQTSPAEMKEYLRESGFNMDLMENAPIFRKPIAPEDLTKEFLKNKDNSN